MTVVCLPGDNALGGLIVERTKKTIILWIGEIEISACLDKTQWLALEDAVTGKSAASQLHIETPVKNETFKVE